ncbi:MAG: CxxxxCH/CxxCH domain-containing protein [Myxococcales bacterium]
MRRTIIAVAALAASAGALPGCSQTPLGTGEKPGAAADCTACHGSKSNGPGEAQNAPPKGLNGELERTAPAVGAHQVHLADSAMRKAIACADCHPVPAALESAGHHDGRIDFSWGALATTGDLKPAYDASTGKCSSVWCHGGALKGGKNTTPSWTGGLSQVICGTCHGLPPPAPHTTSTNCHACHPNTVGADGKILATGMHINGRIDSNKQHESGFSDPKVHGPEASRALATCQACHGEDLEGGKSGVSCGDCHAAGWKTNCTMCHGTAGVPNGAPPADTHGGTATTATTVGAHASHLNKSTFGKPVACTECHLLPASVTSAGHLDGDTATLTWGPLARSGGLTPAWNRTTGTCSSTWCHGGSLHGGTIPEPVWTQVDGTQAKCGTCHGLPPPAPHTTSTNCHDCHPDTVKADGTLDLAKSKHLDGIVEGNQAHPNGWSGGSMHGPAAKANLVSCKTCHGDDLTGGTSGVSCNKCHNGWQSNCVFCHGGLDNQTGAPPVDSTGRSETTRLGVGAHSAHVADSDLRKAMACTECHTVPADAFSAGHLNGTAAVTFGSLAKTGNLSPTWDSANAKCSSTWCHGAGLKGGTITAPQWTKVDDTQAECGTCHGNPPVAPHPANSNCNQCHPQTVRADGKIDVAGGKHVDGELQLTNAHPAGYASGSAHGPDAKATIANCQGCHGQDLNGGSFAPSCNQCHNGFKTNCTFCHGGTDNQTGAPPTSVSGLTATTALAVGAHSAHLAASSNLSKPVACSECHAVPADALTSGHMNGAAALTFGTLAKTKGAVPAFDAASGKCSSVYCHGTKMVSGLGTNTTPTWNVVDNSQDACGTCHGVPPAGDFTNYPKKGGTFRHSDGDHPTLRCSACHPDMNSSGGISNPALHIDGKTDLLPIASGCACH